MSNEDVEKVVLRHGTSLDYAFTMGYLETPLEGIHRYLKTSACYAVYSAGKDRKKIDNKLTNK